jgi:two-component system, sensor histidine kinase PdtaS
MNSLPPLPPQSSSDDRQYLQRLVASWGIVADFCFGDLLLFVPAGTDGSLESFTVVGQVRPTTSRTLYHDDLVGREVSAAERPLLRDAMERSVIVDGQNFTLSFGQSGGHAARVEYVPVVRVANGIPRTIAVLTRESEIDVARRPGRLERVYVDIFHQMTSMIANGLFPYDEAATSGIDAPTEAPRVGDGVIAIDANRIITYASPNAVSALHRLGMYANAEGRSLSALGVGLGAADACFTTGTPILTEVERINPQTNARMIVSLHALPLLQKSERITASGAVVLLRDVSDLRRRDRLLMTKDATIREVHHRVKNNLQTISALLRLQGRRTTSVEARQAIEESARRIRAIALVHETLSRDVRDAVPFDEIVRPLVRMVEESIVSPDQPIRITVEGSLGDLPAETATPLAVTLTELIQNAVEHGFPPERTPRRSGLVQVRLLNTENELSIEVRDNGVGLPEGFSLGASKSLGLSIVRTLVTSELGGAIAFRSDNGTVAQLRIPRARTER